MTRIEVDAARKLAVAVLGAAGAPASYAARVAQGLIASDEAGVATHGLAQLPRYVRAAQSGELDPRAVPVVTVDGPAIAQVAGRWTFGHVAADVAVEAVIAKVATQGAGVVALVECHHIGRMGEFVEIAARQGVALTIYGGGQGVERPSAVPYGGRTAILHTNPIAIGAPAEPDRPFVVDIATTVTSGLKVDQLAATGGTLPPDTIVDAAGEPTTDPRALGAGGAHLPFGQHKGYGFMLAAEIFGRIATGADDVAETQRGGPWLRHAGYLLAGFAIDAFTPRHRYDARVRDLFGRIRAIEPSPGFTKVQVPGDLEAASRLAGAVTLDYPDGLLTELADLAQASPPPNPTEDRS